MKIRKALITLALLAAAGCAGKDGQAGQNGQDGRSCSVTTNAAQQQVLVCPDGTSTILPAGAAGQNGESTLARVSAEPAGSNCPSGGQKIETGVDANGDGVLQDSEVSGTSYVCNGQDGASGSAGQAGSAGATSLVWVYDAPDTSGCPGGGKAISVGIDLNGNGVLDAEEITSTTYVCNGADGASGAAGQTGAAGEAALVSVADEPAGSNCPSGGKAISTGLDANGNGVLDPAEITGTSYVCNGADGANGLDGANGTNGVDGRSCTTTISSNDVVRVSCTDGTSAVMNDAPVTPVAVTTSSVSGSWVGEGALSPDFNMWMSGTDTGNPEWITYDFGAGVSVLPTFVEAYIVNGRDGSPTFQGSNDGSTWTDLASYDWSDFQFGAGPLGAQGCGYYGMAIPAPTDVGYRYLRVYSAGAPYLAYNWLQFRGVILPQ